MTEKPFESTTWEEMANFLQENIDSPLISSLKILANDPKELSLADPSDFAEVAGRGILTKRTKVLLFQFLDRWCVLKYALKLEETDILKCKQFANVPSDLLHLDEYENDQVSLELFSCKSRRLSTKIHSLFNQSLWNSLYTVDDVEETVVERIKRESLDLQDVNSLFIDMIKLLTTENAVTTREVFIDDESAPNIITGYTCNPCMLVEKSNVADSVALDLSFGIIHQIDIFLSKFTDHIQPMCYIDVSQNRLDSDQWKNIVNLLDIIDKNKGALIIHSNPLVSLCGGEKNDFLVELVLKYPKKSSRLIFVSQKQLRCYNAARSVDIVLKSAGKQIARLIDHCHIAFYNAMAKVRNTAKFNSLPVRNLRFFRPSGE